MNISSNVISVLIKVKVVSGLMLLLILMYMSLNAIFAPIGVLCNSVRGMGIILHYNLFRIPLH